MSATTIRTPESAVQVLRTQTKIRGHILLAIHLSKSMVTAHIQRVKTDATSTSKIVREMIIRKTDGLIIAKNDPDCTSAPVPQAEDIKFTKYLVKMSQILGVCVLDHILLSKKGYYSFKKNGRVFPKGNTYVFKPGRKLYRLICG